MYLIATNSAITRSAKETFRGILQGFRIFSISRQLVTCCGVHNGLQSAGTDHPLLLIRPLLDLPKSHLVEACREAGLTWANDPTNQDTAFLRNHLRALMAQSPPASLSATDASPPSDPLSTQQNRPVALHACTDTMLEQFISPAQVLQPGYPSRSASHSSDVAQCAVAEAQSQEAQSEHSRSSLASAEAASQGKHVQHSVLVAALHVQRRCAAAHEAIAAQARHVLRISLEQGCGAFAKSCKAGENDEMLDCCLAVQPIAQAETAVALHTLSAALQVGAPAATPLWDKQLLLMDIPKECMRCCRY